MKYVLDENCYMNNGQLPLNMINARDFFHLFSNKYFSQGIPDTELLRLAKKTGYVIITKDKGMVLKANSQQMNIIYIQEEKRHEYLWFFISNTVRIKSRVILQNRIRTVLNKLEFFEDYEKIHVIG